MTDRPADDGNRTRSDAASRLAALLADVVEEEGPDAEPDRPTDAPTPSDEGAVRRRVVRRRSDEAADGGEVRSAATAAEVPDLAEPATEASESDDTDGAPAEADPEATVAVDMVAALGGAPSSDRSDPTGRSDRTARIDGGPDGSDASGGVTGGGASDGSARSDDQTDGPDPDAGPDGGADETVGRAQRAPEEQGAVSAGAGARNDAATAPADPDEEVEEADDDESSGALALAHALATAGTAAARPSPVRRGAGVPSPATARADAATVAPAGRVPDPVTARAGAATGGFAARVPKPTTARAGAATPVARTSRAPARPWEPEVEVPPLRRVTPRAVAFGVAFLVLLAAVPALGWVGKERLLDSRGGNVVDATQEAGDPGYKALVEPTQTALVIQRATPEGPVVATTLLALGMGQTGGSVIQVPLDTETRNPVFALDRLGQVAETGSSDSLTEAVANRLNVAIPTTIELDDTLLASLVSPVAPLTIDNPDPVLTDTGQVYAAGEVALTAEELGPFLRAGAEDESELGRLARNEVVWAAWLDAIGQSDEPDSVGPATTGIGPFLRTLSGAGAKADEEEVVAPVVETLDVVEQPDADAAELPDSFDVPEPGDDGPNVRPLVPAPGFDEQILEAVPFPRSPGGFGRYNLKLLNGAVGEEVPRPIIDDLILRGAALTTLGNATSFDQEATKVEYTSEDWKDLAELAGESLGGAEVSLMPPAQAEAEGDDIVITIGQDVLDRYGE